MHSSMMGTARSLIVSPYLVVSHACPPFIMHVSLPMHAPHSPCMPPFAMHAPSNHAHPLATTHPTPSNHACPPTTMHTPWQPYMPTGNHTCPPGNHACPHVDSYKCLWAFIGCYTRFLACRVPWVSPMATGVTINH